MESAELLAVDSAYDKNFQVLTRLLGVTVPEWVPETQVAEHSQAVKPFYRQRPKFPHIEEGNLLVVQVVGKGISMVRRETLSPQVRLCKGDKKTRKKEAIAPYRRTPADVVNVLFKKGSAPPCRLTPCHKQVFASLDGKDAAFKRLAKWVRRRAGPHIPTRVALTDGAEPLQKHMRAKLPGFTLVLDSIHVDARLEARLPIIECPARHMRPLTGSSDILRRLPGLKQRFALIGGGARTVNVLSAHTISIHPFW